jgi:hypothetical protein
MRWLFILAFTVGLGSTSTAALPVAAQDEDYGPLSSVPEFEGVAQPLAQIGAETPLDGAVLQPYEVYFGQQFARLENLDNLENDQTPTFETELMVIEVKQGIFALEVGANGDFIVDPVGETPIQFVELLSSEPYAEPYVVPVAKYVRNAAGNICTNMCALPLNNAVQVKPGDVIIAQAGSYCLWCLLQGSGTELDQASGDVGPKPDSGLLLVSVRLVEPGEASNFSWIEAWTQDGGLATPTVSTSPVTMSWAFNPPSGCH